jgi:hypothetical protein
MSEDHKVYDPRERQRVDANSKITWYPLPCDVSASEVLSAASVHDPSMSIFDFNYPGTSALEEAAEYIKEVVNQVSSADITKGVRYNDPVTYLHAIDQTGNAVENIPDGEVLIQHTESFVANRKLPDNDYEGPEAVFGRYGPSLNMTRSIGDKYGPRRCAAVPDVTVAHIPPEEFGRFVLASDGVWDVLSSADVGKVVFAAMDPDEVAFRIALLAQVRRSSQKKREDDISVIVVDVNPNQNTFVETCCTFT